MQELKQDIKQLKASLKQFDDELRTMQGHVKSLASTPTESRQVPLSLAVPEIPVAVKNALLPEFSKRWAQFTASFYMDDLDAWVQELQGTQSGLEHVEFPYLPLNDSVIKPAMERIGTHALDKLRHLQGIHDRALAGTMQSLQPSIEAFTTQVDRICGLLQEWMAELESQINDDGVATLLDATSDLKKELAENERLCQSIGAAVEQLKKVKDLPHLLTQQPTIHFSIDELIESVEENAEDVLASLLEDPLSTLNEFSTDALTTIVEDTVESLADEVENIDDYLSDQVVAELKACFDALTDVNQMLASVSNGVQALLTDSIKTQLNDVVDRLEQHLKTQLSEMVSDIVQTLLDHFARKSLNNTVVAEIGTKITVAIQQYIPLIITARKAAEALQLAKEEIGG